ncbi:MAG: YggS family pyridoxal phosphate-dependent enzyme [Chloroflexi bacterium]|nr:YggS family pyridoxal phosphate-dependent enzyme [Chloroflexota bacterium]MCY4247762.1 YggS family pyridoxal phosphate-dependent enzyme [Chloroflexota bacterium]
MSIADNIQRVHERIATACARSGRDASEVTLVAVTKQQSVAAALAAVAAGLQHLGENRVEEAAVKIPPVDAAAAQPLTWHMVGHIQSRKARQVAPLFDIVQSIDSLRLAKRLSRLGHERERDLPALLQINVSGEASKYGLSGYHWHRDAAVHQRLWQEISAIMALPGLEVRGLMTMAPFGAEERVIRRVFADMYALRESLDVRLPVLSMGMTDDFPIAIEEGATMIRVGRAIFGERNK